MILAVLSNKDQYKALSDSSFNMSDIKVLCDNPDLYGFLSDEGVEFEALREESIKESWEEINTWACEKALLWDRHVKDSSFFDGVELNKALYVYFSFYLVSFLKNYLFSELIYDKYNPEEVVVFDNVTSSEFPLFNGNYFLNMFLGELAAERNLKTLSISLEDHKPLSISKKEKIRSFAQDLYSRLYCTSKKDKVFVACGTLKHLERVMAELKKEGKKVIVFDFAFQPEQLVFCLKRGIRYYVPRLPEAHVSKPGAGTFDYKEDFIKALKSLRSKEWFKYKNKDLSGLLCGELSSSSSGYLEGISSWASIYEQIIDTYDVEGLIVNEDLSPRRGFMTAFFKSRGISTFCISHGYGPVKFSLREPDRTFVLSETFVHSRYERELYSSKGWDERHLHVTGVPRCDSLVELKRKIKARPKGGKRTMKVMFCGNTLHGFTPGDPSYIGESELMWGENMRVCLKDVINSIEGHDIELIVRPHSWHVDDRELWTDLISKIKGTNKVRLASPKADFFDLLYECDAMILGYWSTAAIEGIIFGIPTVVLDHTGLEDKHDFAKKGLCTVARSFNQLNNIVNDLFTSFATGEENSCPSGNTGDNTFYTGINDGVGTQRVTARILKRGKNETDYTDTLS